jgi:hypothetical protein
VSALSRESDAVCLRHADRRAALLDAAPESPGATDTALHAAVFRGNAVPQALAVYVQKLRSESSCLTENDVNRLIAAGCSEDAIFKVTIAGVLGVADERLQAGLRALKRD